MPADFNDDVYMQTYLDNVSLYLERIDRAMIHYNRTDINEKCVQRAISDLLKNKYDIGCERERPPCMGSRLKMDLSGEGFIVEVKMTASNLHLTIAQLLHYAKKRKGSNDLWIAIHDEESYDFADVDDCDAEGIFLIPASQCAEAINQQIILYKENPTI
jgi:hypothetical protein